MDALLINDYAAWRVKTGLVPVLHEKPPVPPERLLQVIWYHQRLRRHELRTLDGRSLQVLHPGFWNGGAGPDFRRSVVQFEGEDPRQGDVEVDVHPSGWQSHRHAGNPSFDSVILHVVWKAADAAGIPTLALDGKLDAPLEELAAWLNTEPAQSLPDAILGRCVSPLKRLGASRVTRLLQQAALVRLQAKASRLQARARQAGWEQALWEGLFRALGYQHNAWPMQRLAELRPALKPSPPCDALLQWQARLFGVSGLLPRDLGRRRAGGGRYLRRLWDVWWRERDQFDDSLLPAGLWRLHGLRPANHPQRRLALAARWLATEALLQRLEKWFTAITDHSPLVSSLQAVLNPDRDEFWSWHWTFTSPPLATPQALLGGSRVTELAMNVVLPWFWIRARDGKNDVLRQRVERVYYRWPAGEDNTLLRLGRYRLFGEKKTALLCSAAVQQGLLQVVQDFCDRSNALCAGCPFPGLVQEQSGPSIRPSQSDEVPKVT